uniref:non-specific serine/threonine protein kinase n=1 Tax=Oreochromis niloticus TaxID=8128 RepID=A0A669BDM3_ORENI
MMMISSGLLPPCDPLNRTNDTQTHSRTRTDLPSVSNMDSSGGTTASQDAHLDLRSSPGRSDLSGLYHLGRTLGRGHFAVVKLGRNVNTGQLVAVKMIDKTKLDVMATSHLLQEVRCMRRVQHPNVVRLYEVIDTPTTLYLVMELAEERSALLGTFLYSVIMVIL